MTDNTVGSTHRPLRDMVTAELRRLILTGELTPGERLVEDRPVREAIRVLATEGFVEVTPRRGAAVARFPAEEAEELFDVRMALEGLTARLSARKVTAESSRRLRQVLDSARIAVDEGRLDEVADLNTAFHGTVAETAGNAYLHLVVGPMLRRAQWVFQQTARHRAPHSWTEHLGLYEAIAAGDEAEAEARAVAHVAAARRSYLAALRET
jgi:DNA-binding GntR family transcriptional regulator